MNAKKDEIGLSAGTRKALCVHLGEDAGSEIAQLLLAMAAQIEELRRTKVNVTQVIPDPTKPDPILAALESESF